MHDNHSSVGVFVSPLCRATVWLASFAAVLTLGANSARAVQSGHTTGTSTNLIDTDADSLVDRLERMLGSSPALIDTDGDAYSDLEEFARQMPLNIPRVNRPRERLRLGMGCYGRDRQIHVVVAVYVPDGDFRRVRLQIGMASNGRIIDVSSSHIAANAEYRVRPAMSSYARIVFMDITFPNVVATLHDVTFFATAGRMATGEVTTADALQLLLVDGVVVVAMDDPTAAAVPGGNGTLAASPAGRGITRTIFVPLLWDDEGDAPNNWTPGQVCFQSSSTVGGNGSSVTHEVVSAECRDGWDGGCPPSCSSTVGSTRTTLDPLTLIGG